MIIGMETKAAFWLAVCHVWLIWLNWLWKHPTLLCFRVCVSVYKNLWIKFWHSSSVSLVFLSVVNLAFYHNMVSTKHLHFHLNILHLRYWIYIVIKKQTKARNIWSEPLKNDIFCLMFSIKCLMFRFCNKHFSSWSWGNCNLYSANKNMF